jgi:hypothetical protein
MTIEIEKRQDAPREGAMRFTVIVEKKFVTYLKNYAKKHQLRITDMIGDCFEQYIERLKSGRERH